VRHPFHRHGEAFCLVIENKFLTSSEVPLTYSILRAAQHDRVLLQKLQQHIETTLGGSVPTVRRTTQATKSCGRWLPLRPPRWPRDSRCKKLCSLYWLPWPIKSPSHLAKGRMHLVRQVLIKHRAWSIYALVNKRLFCAQRSTAKVELIVKFAPLNRSRMEAIRVEGVEANQTVNAVEP